MALVAMTVGLEDAEPEMPFWALILVSTLVPVFVFFAVLLYGYVYGDAKRRGMRAVLWLLLAIFIPNAIGVILYFVLREPLPIPCASCGAPVNPGFAYCPSCGKQTRAACPECQRAVESGWSNCAYCGAKLN
jgi:hypothetical protein